MKIKEIDISCILIWSGKKSRNNSNFFFVSKKTFFSLPFLNISKMKSKNIGEQKKYLYFSVFPFFFRSVSIGIFL